VLFDINNSLVSFCDDLNVISPSVKLSQKLLDVCSNFGDNKKMKFNPKKSKVVNFGRKIFKNVNLTVNGTKIDHVKDLKILGYWFNESLNNNNYLVENFTMVRKSFFSLNMFGMKPYGLILFLQAFLYTIKKYILLIKNNL
jgi:hypothetical protein